jgi:hypothetical protein
MAKKEEKKETPKPAEKGEKKAKKKGNAPKASLFLLVTIIMSAVFLPSSVLLAIGMLPTLAALFANPHRARTQVVTVGAMNLAGCMPFLLELWTDGHTLDQSFAIISNPQAIIVMYAAAAIGYMLDWAMSAIVSGILYQRGIARQEAIRKRQAELVERWGREITGELPLDPHGFALQSPGKEE